MACDGNVWCELATFLSQHGLFLNEASDFLANIISGDTEGLPVEIANRVKWVRENFGNIVSLGIGCLGIWKWWHYRERILHLRLAEYLADQDRRLESARADLLEALHRPGPGKKFSDPVFADKRLKRVLRERRWDFDIFGSFVTRSVNADLDGALERIDRKLEAVRDLSQNFQNQRASAHLLRGAVAAAEAGTTLTMKTKDGLNNLALLQFRAALQTPGFEHDVDAKEFEAHQLRKLGRRADASASYQAVIECVKSEKNVRKRELSIARSKRFLGELHQVRALEGWLLAANANGGSWNSLECYKSALELRKMHGPFEGWDSIDQAELHFAAAYTHCRLGNSIEEATHLEEARDQYDVALREAGFIRSFSGEAVRRLRKQAKRGKIILDRVKPSDPGTYDINWLVPKELGDRVRDKHGQMLSNNPQNKPQPVSPAGGDQGVREAP